MGIEGWIVVAPVCEYNQCGTSCTSSIIQTSNGGGKQHLECLRKVGCLMHHLLPALQPVLIPRPGLLLLGRAYFECTVHEIPWQSTPLSCSAWNLSHSDDLVESSEHRVQSCKRQLGVTLRNRRCFFSVQKTKGRGCGSRNKTGSGGGKISGGLSFD